MPFVDMRMANILAAGVLILCAGCGTATVHSHNYAEWPPHPYEGVQYDYHEFVIATSFQPYDTPSLLILDTPFSLIGDTLTLPYDLCKHSKEHSEEQGTGERSN
jgi:uncharacterized protein YceK